MPLQTTLLNGKARESGSVTTALIEIAATLKHLDENQKSLTALIASLVEAKAEHTVEIRHINLTINNATLDLKEINQKISKIEAAIVIKKEDKNWGFRALEVMREYWHIFAIMASLISFILSIFFGYKTKGDL